MRAKIFRWGVDQLWRLWYPVLTRLTRNASVVFLNYGYAYDAQGGAPLLKEQDEPDRPCIQLYHRVVSAVEVRGLELLEVSCGHGGGASYVARYLGPKSLRGVDRNPRAIELCAARHLVDSLAFFRGDALALEFGDNTFDAVINIEASHCYPDVPRFLSEVRRVLRPGGHFLYADFRDRDPDLAILRGQLEASGLEVVSCEDISKNVLRGMQMNTEKYMGLIQRLLPRPLRKPAMGFAGVKGSGIYRALESGETVYLCYHLRKPAQP